MCASLVSALQLCRAARKFCRLGAVTRVCIARLIYLTRIFVERIVSFPLVATRVCLSSLSLLSFLSSLLFSLSLSLFPPFLCHLSYFFLLCLSLVLHVLHRLLSFLSVFFLCSSLLSFLSCGSLNFINLQKVIQACINVSA